MAASAPHSERPDRSFVAVDRRGPAGLSLVPVLLAAILVIVALGSLIHIGVDGPSTSIRAAETEAPIPEATDDRGDAVDQVPVAGVVIEDIGPAGVDRELPDAIWPAPARGRRFDGAQDVVLSFAGQLAGFEDPMVGQLIGFDGRTGTIQLQARAGGPITAVRVERSESGGSWWVMGAASEGLRVTRPSPGSTIGDSLHVGGDAWSPDGVVTVGLRGDDASKPVLTFDVPTGGADEPYWFEARFGFVAPGPSSGVVLFSNRFADSGEVASVTAIRVHFGS